MEENECRLQSVTEKSKLIQMQDLRKLEFATKNFKEKQSSSARKLGQHAKRGREEERAVLRIAKGLHPGGAPSAHVGRWGFGRRYGWLGSTHTLP